MRLTRRRLPPPPPTATRRPVFLVPTRRRRRVVRPGMFANNEGRIAIARVFLGFAPVLAVGRIDVTATTHFLGTRPKLFREDVIVPFQMSLGRVPGRRGEGPGGRRFGRRRRREERQEGK